MKVQHQPTTLMKRLGVFLFTLFLLIGLTGLSACNGSGSGGAAQGSDVSGTPAPIPTDAPPPTGSADNPSASPALGETCHTGDANHICLSLKYVVYKDESGQPVVPDSQVIENIAQINQVWSQCDLGFEIGEYVVADPTQSGLIFNTSSSGELDRIRDAYGDDSNLLVVTTGEWSGSLGAGSANAWTNMPGTGTYGAILEASVGNYPNIIAHELGHYLNLDHVSDASDVMSPIIYDTSTALTASQCDAARSAAAYYWQAMVR